MLSNDSPFLLSQHILDCVILLSESLCLQLKSVFLRLELSRSTTIAAEIGQAIVDLQLKVN